MSVRILSLLDGFEVLCSSVGGSVIGLFDISWRPPLDFCIDTSVIHTPIHIPQSHHTHTHTLAGEREAVIKFSEVLFKTGVRLVATSFSLALSSLGVFREGFLESWRERERRH